MTLVLRPMYGNPCRAPARLMEMILLDTRRRELWAHQLREMVDRVREVRNRPIIESLTLTLTLQIRVKLRTMMEERCPNRDWSSITSQV